MFGSQVIKCYELPYCTLEILTENRFRLLIESLNQGEEPTFQLSSDRAHLSSLAETIKTHSVSPPSHPQPQRQPLYSISFVTDDQSHHLELNWGQLSDLAKLLGQYQSDIAQNPNLKQKQGTPIASVIVLILVVTTGGVIWRSEFNSSPRLLTSSPPVTNSSSTPSSPAPSNTAPSQLLEQPQLKLSDSLEKLDQLSPPTSVITPTLTEEAPAPLPKPPLPDAPAQPPKPELQTPDFPPLTPPNPAQNLSPEPQPDSLFDQTPQVAEIRQYFQKRWQPPKTLKQDLEYQIRVNADGSLQQIMPLGRIANSYLSSLPLPESNQSFVSPSTTTTPQKIRLVFRANGQIKTFLMGKK